MNLKHYTFLIRMRWALLPVLITLFLQLLFAVFAECYRIQPSQLVENRRSLTITFQDRKPLLEYISSLGRRDIFRESVLYPKNQSEKIDYLEGVNFIGVSFFDGAYQALLVNKKSQTPSFYKVGDKLGDLIIIDIQYNSIKFKHGDQELELKL